jgi:uncharacterized membrane protein
MTPSNIYGTGLALIVAAVGVHNGSLADMLLTGGIGLVVYATVYAIATIS